jgi:hypothetical protein
VDDSLQNGLEKFPNMSVETSGANGDNYNTKSIQKLEKSSRFFLLNTSDRIMYGTLNFVHEEIPDNADIAVVKKRKRMMFGGAIGNIFTSGDSCAISFR